MSASVKRLRDATSKGRGRRRRHGRHGKGDDAAKQKDAKNGAGAEGSKPRPLAPLHLLALLHNLAASNGGRRDSTTCGGFFSSTECSSRSTSFDDFGDYDGEAAVDFEADDGVGEEQLRTPRADKARGLLASSASSLSSTSSWSSTDSGEWSDWEDPLWVKDDMLLHSCDRDALLAATIAAGLGEAANGTQQADADPRRRRKKKKSRRRRKASDIIAITDHTETTHTSTAPLADVPMEVSAVPSHALDTDATPTEPTDDEEDVVSLKTSPPRRGDVVQDQQQQEQEQQEQPSSKEDDADEELVWHKRTGIEALAAKTQELRLSEAEDPVTAASAAVLDLSLDSVSDLGSDTITTAASEAEMRRSEDAVPSAANHRQREEEWREAVALNQRLLHSDITFRLPDRQSGSWRGSPPSLQQRSFSTSAPLPPTPCLTGLTSSPRRIPPPRPPRPTYREFAPMASAGAIPVARRWPPTPSSTPACEAEPVNLSGSGSRTRDMQIIREMIEEQLKQVTHKRAHGKRRQQLAARIVSKEESAPTATTANEATKPKASKKAKEGGSQGRRKKLRRKTKQWLSLRRHKEKASGDGDDDDCEASERSVDRASTVLASVLNSTTIHTRRKETTGDDGDDVPKGKEAESDTGEKDQQQAKPCSNERLMKIPVLDLTAVEKPAVKDATPKPMSTPSLMTSASLPALSMSAAATPCSVGFDASPRPQATTPTGAATHRPRNVSDPTGGSSDPLSPRRVWQAVTTPVTAASSRLRQRQSRRFDHNPLSNDPLEWVASPLFGLLRQRRQQHRDKCRSLHLPESPVAAHDDDHNDETAVNKTPALDTEKRGQHLPEPDVENDAQNASSSSGEAKATSDKKPRRKRSASVRERRPGTQAGRTLHAAA